MKFIPLVFLVVICLIMGVAITSRQNVEKSPLLGKPFPTLALPGAETIGVRKEVSMVNVFATWCVPCAAEHEQLVTLARQHHIPITGIAWKNKREDVSLWVTNRGNPYQTIIHDEKGDTTLPLGISGVPETFILTATGKVAYHTNEPITETKLQDEILPLIEELKR